jgi:hypothetical protein
MRYQDLALPINVTKLTSPFLIELLNKGFISDKDKNNKQKRNNFRYTEYNNRFPEPTPPKKKIEKSIK